MIDKNTELKAGGRVRISGVWHDLRCEPDNPAATPMIHMGEYTTSVRSMLTVIEEYEPPTPKAEPFPWLNVVGWDCGFGFLYIADDVNESLTKAYGDPTIRTYADEDAAEFGLLGTTDVLVRNGGEHVGHWEHSEFRHLEEGDWWRLQPAAPKGVKA